VIGLAPSVAASSAGPAAAARPAAAALPAYYLALPGGDNFANVPGSRTAVVGDTLTGKRLLTIRAFGTFFATKPLFRFGVFSHDRYTPLPLPPTTTTVPATIAW
jgi:hypothetical protein